MSSTALIRSRQVAGNRLTLKRPIQVFYCTKSALFVSSDSVSAGGGEQADADAQDGHGGAAPRHLRLPGPRPRRRRPGPPPPPPGVWGWVCARAPSARSLTGAAPRQVKHYVRRWTSAVSTDPGGGGGGGSDGGAERRPSQVPAEAPSTGRGAPQPPPPLNRGGSLTQRGGGGGGRGPPGSGDPPAHRGSLVSAMSGSQVRGFSPRRGPPLSARPVRPKVRKGDAPARACVGGPIGNAPHAWRNRQAAAAPIIIMGVGWGEGGVEPSRSWVAGASSLC